jgi:hypothetical protein
VSEAGLATVLGLILAAVAAVTGVVAVLYARHQARASKEHDDAVERLERFQRARRRLRESYDDVLRRASESSRDQLLRPDLRILGLPGYLLPAPIDLADVDVRLDDVRERASYQPIVERWAKVWPLSRHGTRLDRYSDAIVEHDKPALWFGGPSYRLVDARPVDGKLSLSYEIGDYHDAVNTQEVHGFLWAADLLTPGSTDRPDPFDFRRRCASTAVCTLTIVRGDVPTFLMHLRDPDRVAVAGNQFHVTPAGEFEPSSIRPDVDRDFDLWRNIQREYAEEFLGLVESFGGRSGAAPDYDRHPFADLDELRGQGEIDVRCLGIGVNPLTLKPEILTTAVFSASAFEQVFPGLLTDPSLLPDDEGTKLISAFTEADVERYLAHDRINPLAHALLRLAWESREVILAPS